MSCGGVMLCYSASGDGRFGIWWCIYLEGAAVRDIWTTLALKKTAIRSVEKSVTTRPTTEGHRETDSNLLTTPVRKPPISQDSPFL